MALYKTMTSDQGVATAYHRIKRVTLTDKTTVDVAHYASEDYRDKEKANQAAVTARDDLYAALSAATEETEIADLTAQINAWTLPNPAGDYAVSVTAATFDLDKDAALTFSDLYDRIKALDDYGGAQDV